MSKMWSFLSILFKQEKKNKKQVESGKLTIIVSLLNILHFVQLIKIKFWYFIGVYNNKYNITYGR